MSDFSVFLSFPVRLVIPSDRWRFGLVVTYWLVSRSHHLISPLDCQTALCNTSNLEVAMLHRDLWLIDWLIDDIELEVTLRRSWLVNHLSRYVTSHSRQLSLAAPLWLRAITSALRETEQLNMSFAPVGYTKPLPSAPPLAPDLHPPWRVYRTWWKRKINEK